MNDADRAQANWEDPPGPTDEPPAVTAPIALAELEATVALASPAPWSVWLEPVETRDDAKRELAKLVDGTPMFSAVLPMLSAGDLSPAVTGCGTDGVPNANAIVALRNAAPALIAAANELIAGQARLVVVIDEAFGYQPAAESFDALVGSLERLLFERRKDTAALLVERDRLQDCLRTTLQHCYTAHEDGTRCEECGQLVCRDDCAVGNAQRLLAEMAGSELVTP